MSSYNVKEMMSKKERLAPGHRMCAGCGATIGVRAVLRALHEEDHAVIANATGCLEVSSFMYPYSAWEDSYIQQNMSKNSINQKTRWIPPVLMDWRNSFCIWDF